ncbi:MAG TPA: hypothetical protein VKT77_19995 [Chthonomonadaceae bacterium]|nr:hypothetical protein [Chthonomonadaceae bacterium]
MGGFEHDRRIAELLLGRREVILAAGGCLAALLSGCGGGSGGAGGTKAIGTTGRVVLPPGASMAHTGTSVVAGGSLTTPSAGGQFNAAVYTPEPSLAVLIDGSGNSLLMGFLDPQSGANTIDATSTAAALLYFAIGGPVAPIANKAQILQLLAAHPVVAPLASTIAARFAANPLALQSGDAQVSAALETAYGTLTASVLRAAVAQPAPGAPHDAGPAVRRADVQPNELVQPSGQQSGVEVVQPGGSLGVQAINHFRRRAQMFVYRVGEVSTAGVTTTYPTAVPVGSRLDISATTALGLFSTLDNLFSGTTAFTPVTTAPQPLSLQPNTKQTNFEVVVLGASGSDNPAFFSDPKYSQVSQTWLANVQNLNLFTAIGDVALGFILELWGLRFVITDAAPVQAVLDGLATIQTKAPTIAEVLAVARKGGYKQAVIDLIEAAASSDIVSKQMKEALKPYIRQLENDIAVKGGETISSKLMASAFRLISAAFTPVGVTLGLGDLAAIAHDLAASNPGELWTVNLVQPTFSLSPQTTSVAPGGRATFAVKLPTDVTGSFVFDWSQSSPFATLSASSGKVGNTLETTDTSTTVDLITTSSDTQPITVTVTAFEVDAKGNRTRFGVASATATIGFATTEPASPVIVTKVHTIQVDGVDVVKPLIYGFLVFAQRAGATEYVLNNVPLHASEISASVPVIDQARNDDLSTFVPYVVGQNRNFFNFGGGSIGLLIDQFDVFPADEQRFTTLIQQELAGTDPTVTIS